MDQTQIQRYVPSQFARQFGYDQLYVGNLNSSLTFMGVSSIELVPGGVHAAKDFEPSDDPGILPVV